MALKGKTYTTYEIAEICDVYPTTVIGWIKKNKIPAFRTPGGHRRVLESDLRDFLSRHDIPLPDGLSAARGLIAVVEDDKAVGRLLQRVLQKAFPGHEVRWLRDGIGALLAIGQRPPDLLVLDVVMPVVDGSRVLASLRADPATRAVPVIGITGKRLPPEKLAFFRRHANAFYLKPFDPEALVRKATALLGVPRRI